MAYKTIRIGRHSGLPWMGLNERIEDGAQMPNEASAGQNFRVNKGVLETRPGITHATEVSARPTSYYVTLGATGQIRYDSADQYDVINGRVRWLWVLSVRTPASFSGTHWIIHRGVTIGGTQYEQGVYVDSNGKVYVKLVDSAGGDKTFNSGANTLSVDTNYVITVGRFDTDAYLNWGTETSSPTVGVMGTTSDLGELDHAWSSGSGAHTLNIGHEYDLGTTTPSNYWKGEIHEVTLLQYYVNHAPDPSTGWYCEFGWTSFADPLDPRCALHCRYNAASGALIDLSTHGNDSSVNTGVTYQQTTNAFVEESAVVQSIDEFTNSNDQERIVTVIDGTIVVGNINV